MNSNLAVVAEKVDATNKHLDNVDHKLDRIISDIGELKTTTAAHEREDLIRFEAVGEHLKKVDAHIASLSKADVKLTIDNVTGKHQAVETLAITRKERVVWLFSILGALIIGILTRFLL